MAKALRTAALIVGAVALVATGVGAALGAAATSAWAAGSATAAGLASAAGTAATVASIASIAAGVLSVAASLTASRPSAASTGNPEQFSADPEGFIPYMVGRAGTSGNIVFRRAWDTADKGDNDRQAFGVVLSGGGPIASIDSFTADTAAVTFNSSGAAAGGGFGGSMWQRTQLGAIPTTAAMDFGVGAGTPPGWGADRRMHGLAAATWTLKFDTKGKIYASGVPAPKWVGRGVLCYDPRKDSTFPGGSGSHRWADPANTAAFDAARATWEYSDNPFLQGVRWALGTWERDPTVSGSVYVKTFGLGLPVTGVDVGAFVQGANVADANAWKVSGVVYSGDDKWDSLKKMLQAGMGEPVMLGAMLSCFVNAPKVSLATINPGDVVGDASVAATQSRRDRINRVVPRYVQEVKQWQLLPGTPVAVPSYYAIDGGQRTKTVDFPLIPDADGGKQIATACRYAIEDAREFGPISLPLKLRWIGYKPGDCVTANLPELGLVNQTILLTNREFDPAAGVPTFTARSETNAKHAFALGQTTVAPPTPGVSAAPLVPVPGVTAWAITGTSIAVGASPVAGLVITGAVDSPVAEAIVFEYRPFQSGQAADVNWIGAGVLAPMTTKVQIASVQPTVAYEVAVSYQRGGATGARLILGPVTTGVGATRNVVRGNYDPGTTYAPGDLVNNQGAVWSNTQASTGTAPPTLPATSNAVWTLFVQAGDSSAALAQIAIIQSDAYLSRSEKPELVRDVSAIQSEYGDLIGRATALSVSTTAYTSAYNALNSFLSGLSPAWNDTSQDTALPDNTTLQSRFAAYYSQAAALSTAIGTNLSTSIANIASDNYVSAGAEKGELVRDFNAAGSTNSSLYGTSTSIAAKFGGDPTGTQRQACSDAFNAIQNYLNSLTTNWTDLTQGLAVNGATLRTLFQNFETASDALDQANQVFLATESNAALAQLFVIASDGYLSRGEKPAVIRDWAAIYNETTPLANQAAPLGLSGSSVKAAWDGARNALSAYLSGLSPAWNDTSQDTPIVAATFNANFSAYYAAKTDLLNAMTAAAAQSAATVNRIRFSRFEGGTRGWADYDPNNIGGALHAGSNLGKQYIDVSGTATAAGQTVGLGIDHPSYDFNVTPGEQLCVALGTQALGPIASREVTIFFYNAAGNSVSAPGQDQTFAGTAGYDTRVAFFVTVPAGAVKAQIQYYIHTSGSGAFDMAITDPMVCAVSLGTTVAPTFVPGPNSDDGADVTSQNTALNTMFVGGQSASDMQADVATAKSTATTAQGLASTGAQLAADVADNGKFSSTEKKRWVEKINSLTGQVANAIAEGNTLGLTSQTAALQTQFTSLTSYLNSVNYTDTAHTTSISSATFKSYVYNFDNAATALASAAQAYAQKLSVYTSPSIFTDAAFQRLPASGSSNGEWKSVTLSNGALAEDSGDGRRLRVPGGSSNTRVDTAWVTCSQNDRFDAILDFYNQNMNMGGLAYMWMTWADNGFGYLGVSQIFAVEGSSTPANQWLTNRTGTCTAPASAAYCSAYLQTTHTSGTAYFRNPRLSRQASGATNNIDQTGRQTSALLTTTYAVNGSLQVNGLSISYSSGNITISDFSVDFGDGYQSISGTTISGVSSSAVYYIWLLAPNMSNTGRSFSVSTSFTGNGDKQRIYLGLISTSTGTGAGGGSGGGFCVDEASFLIGGRRAGAVASGDVVELLRPDWGGREIGLIESNDRAVADCVKLTTARGAELICSSTTPIELPDGSFVAAPAAAGKPVAVMLDDGFHIDAIVGVRPAGRRWVARIHVGGRIYAAGLRAGARIFTHNPQKP